MRFMLCVLLFCCNQFMGYFRQTTAIIISNDISFDIEGVLSQVLTKGNNQLALKLMG